MNWIEIGDKYPKAVDKLAESLKTISNFKNFVVTNAGDLVKNYSGFSVMFNDRDLYDFFDENEMLVQVMTWFSMTEDGVRQIPFTWIYTIEYPIDGVLNTLADGDDVEYIARTEAEGAAFEKAFEILENKLK